MIHSSIKKRFPLLGIFCCLVASISAQVAFQETSFSNAQIIIEQEKLPYIIYFYGDWCPSCQLMEETTFKNKKVRNRIDENYVVFKVNADSERGKEWMNIYGVTSVPTTLFYNQDNYLLNKLATPVTVTDFLKLTQDLGKISPKATNNVQLSTLAVKNKTVNSTSPRKRIINSSPKNLMARENLKETIMALDVEIQTLKDLIKKETRNNNISIAANKVVSRGQKTNDFTPKGSNQLSNNHSFPTVENLTAQIESCKSLLTGGKNIQRLVHILEDYQTLLVLQQTKELSQTNNAIPAKHKASIVKSIAKKPTKYENKYAYNQAIIQYLKLAPPIKQGNQFIVQIGKYENIRNAERVVQKIQDKYDYPIKIDIQKKGDTPVQVVYIGEFKTQKEAIAANENLKWIDRKGIVKQF